MTTPSHGSTPHTPDTSAPNTPAPDATAPPAATVSAPGTTGKVFTPTERAYLAGQPLAGWRP
ncbi:hypothetical protein [Streptomyces sp. RPA4-5]|uniref:hypothetical protein n=1 Tax=Streptomyces sp. RPA4-5 TaxID=2721245 RepID=UPI0032B45247